MRLAAFTVLAGSAIFVLAVGLTGFSFIVGDPLEVREQLIVTALAGSSLVVLVVALSQNRRYIRGETPRGPLAPAAPAARVLSLVGAISGAFVLAFLAWVYLSEDARVARKRCEAAVGGAPEGQRWDACVDAAKRCRREVEVASVRGLGPTDSAEKDTAIGACIRRALAAPAAH